MTGQDFQDRVNALVVDLQTKGKGQVVQLLFRDEFNGAVPMNLSSDANGVVNAAQLTAINDFLVGLKQVANSFATSSAPVSAANESFRTAQDAHQALIDNAKTSRDALSAALDADPAYQTAKTNLDAVRADATYISSSADYRSQNVSENYAELQAAKGKYII